MATVATVATVATGERPWRLASVRSQSTRIFAVTCQGEELDINQTKRHSETDLH